MQGILHDALSKTTTIFICIQPANRLIILFLFVCAIYTFTIVFEGQSAIARHLVRFTFAINLLIVVEQLQINTFHVGIDCINNNNIIRSLRAGLLLIHECDDVIL